MERWLISILALQALLLIPTDALPPFIYTRKHHNNADSLQGIENVNHISADKESNDGTVHNLQQDYTLEEKNGELQDKPVLFTAPTSADVGLPGVQIAAEETAAILNANEEGSPQALDLIDAGPTSFPNSQKIAFGEHLEAVDNNQGGELSVAGNQIVPTLPDNPPHIASETSARLPALPVSLTSDPETLLYWQYLDKLSHIFLNVMMYDDNSLAAMLRKTFGMAPQYFDENLEVDVENELSDINLYKNPRSKPWQAKFDLVSMGYPFGFTFVPKHVKCANNLLSDQAF